MNLRSVLAIALLSSFVPGIAVAQNASVTQRNLGQAIREKERLDADIRATEDAITFMEARLSDKPAPLKLLRPGYNDLERMNFRNPAEQAIFEIRLKGLRGELRGLQDRARIKSARIATLENTLTKQQKSSVNSLYPLQKSQQSGTRTASR